MTIFLPIPLAETVRFFRRAATAAALSVAIVGTSAGSGAALPVLSSPEQEERMGAAAHPEILKRYGGVFDDLRVGGYVAGVTARIAKASDQPDGGYTVTVLDTPIVNAFALPGGYVYVTRGLLALVNTEAELAAVIAHEIAHVTARHSGERQTANLGAGLLGAILGVATGSQALGQIFNIGASGFLASYNRDQEYEADALGVQTLVRAGYSPYAMAGFLDSLNAQNELNAKLEGQDYDGSRVDWLSTHPATEKRVQQAYEDARQTGIAPGGRELGRDAHLQAIDGMPYGDRPEEGFVRGREFVHPELRFAFVAPQGFTLRNTSEAVFAIGPDGARARFDMGRKSPRASIERYMVEDWARGARVRDVERFTVNGLPAATGTAQIDGRPVRIVAIEYDAETAYRFMLADSARNRGRYENAMRDMVMSFRKLSESEAARVEPLKVAVVTVGRGETVAALASRMAFDDAHEEERFRVLNDLEPGAVLEAGQRVKLVVN